MQIAVITAWAGQSVPCLEQCLDSLRRQAYPCTPFLGCTGDAPAGVNLAGVQVIPSLVPHDETGNAARALASVTAICRGFDGITYLDPGSWYQPDHIERLVAAHGATGAAICTSGCNLFDPSGTLLGQCPESDDQPLDSNCIFLTRAAFGLVAAWYLTPASKDRYVLGRAVRGAALSRTHVPRASVNCRTLEERHYRHFGKEPPPEAHSNTAPVCPAVPVRMADGLLHPILEPNRRGKVSLCMIVRDEEANLPACLESVRDLVDEMVIVDTGSTDRTRAIAQSYGARVFDFAWNDNFADARNESLRHATGDWIFWLDADERLDPTNRELFRRLLAQLPDAGVVYLMKQWSPQHASGGPELAVDQARFFRRLPGVTWQYRLHEQIMPSLQKAGAKRVVTDIVIQHLGYQDPALRLRKLGRNLRILETELSLQPDDPFTLFNMGGTCLEMGDQEKAVTHLERCLEKSPAGASILPKVFVLLSQCHRMASRLHKALERCEEGRKRFPNSPEVCFEEGLVHLARRDSASARKSFEDVLNRPRQPQYIASIPGLSTYLARHHLALALRDLGDLSAAEQHWRETIRETPHFEPAWLGLTQLLLKQKRGEEANELAREAQKLSSPQVAQAIQGQVQRARNS